MGLVYFSILTIAHNITSGYFNPLSAFAGYALGRVPFQEMMYNILTQVIAMGLVIVSFTPITTFMKQI
jgi:hypothetical protein